MTTNCEPEPAGDERWNPESWNRRQFMNRLRARRRDSRELDQICKRLYGEEGGDE